MTVAADGSPPAALTRRTESIGVPSNRMIPLRPHEPSPGAPASQTVCGGPPETAIRFNFPSAMKPRKRLSADQKGRADPSVPASGSRLVSLRRRTQMRETPVESTALKATQRPSGDTLGVPIERIQLG